MFNPASTIALTSVLASSHALNQMRHENLYKSKALKDEDDSYSLNSVLNKGNYEIIVWNTHSYVAEKPRYFDELSTAKKAFEYFISKASENDSYSIELKCNDDCTNNIIMQWNEEEGIVEG